MLNARFIIFTLLLSALALWIGFKQSPSSIQITDSSLKSTDYSWQLFNSTTWQFEKKSEPRHVITQADSVFYQESQKSSDLTHPVITLIEPEQTITIESRSGKTSEESLIELEGDVQLRQYALPIAKIGTTGQNSLLRTEQITYNANTQQAYTDLPVTLTHQENVTSGTGLRADIANRHFQLLSNVKGQYKVEGTDHSKSTPK